MSDHPMSPKMDEHYEQLGALVEHAASPPMMTRCPYCPAEHSTTNEPVQHLDRVQEHLRDRLEAAETLLSSASRFTFGQFCAEHLVDTDGNDYGWVVKKNGKWSQSERLTRDEAVARARQGARDV